MHSTEKLSLDKTYTSDDIVRFAGITHRQLQWWDERGVLKPKRNGHARVYSPAQALQMRVMAELRRKGYTLQQAHAIGHKFFKCYLVDVLRPENEYDFHLVTNGSSVYLVSDPQVFMELLQRSTCKNPMVSVPISEYLTTSSV